jgi:hypothetical protein
LTALTDAQGSSPPAKAVPRPATRGASGRRGRRRSQKRDKRPNEPLILAALDGQAEPLDIRTIAARTGLPPHSASYALKRLAASGVLVQSSRAGARGLPKLTFALPKPADGGKPPARRRRTSKRRGSTPTNPKQ